VPPASLPGRGVRLASRESEKLPFDTKIPDELPASSRNGQYTPNAAVAPRKSRGAPQARPEGQIRRFLLREPADAKKTGPDARGGEPPETSAIHPRGSTKTFGAWGADQSSRSGGASPGYCDHGRPREGKGSDRPGILPGENARTLHRSHGSARRGDGRPVHMRAPPRSQSSMTRLGLSGAILALGTPRYATVVADSTRPSRCQHHAGRAGNGSIRRSPSRWHP